FIEMKTKFLIQEKQLQGFSVEWILDEASSSEVLYDLRTVGNSPEAKQKMAEDIMKNVINEHYFSYFYDKEGNKIKYSSQPKNYGLKAVGSKVMYYFDVMLSKPQALTDNQFTLMIYDPTYYVSMYYANKSAVDFSAVPDNCQGEMIDPTVDEKTRQYALSLDKSQREADFSLGAQFAQQVVLQCK
ncbi:MAG TPA: DUF1007 domain-containing protein, partial [Pasteurellaceae bacterium]|nr:DUF1007 domain-containing protein [Pasteurellaceae bacterium]